MHGTDDFRTSQVHESPKGSEFVIQKDGSLFNIHMKNGGVRPDFINQKFTSYKLAKAALDRYFRNNPKPIPRDEKKPVKKTDE